MKYLSRESLFLSLIISSFLMLTACEQSSSTSPGGLTTAHNIGKPMAAYSYRATDNSWPKLTDNAGTIAGNILAKNYYVVLDGSGSMSGSECAGGSNKMAVAKEAIITFAKQLPANANLGLFIFDNNGQSERVALRENNQSDFIHAVNAVRANNGTPLYSAVRHGYLALEKQAIKQLGYGEYHLVIVTDGEASVGEDPTNAVDEILMASPIVIHTIGFCIDENHSLNKRGVTYYRAADNPESLQQGLEAVLAEASSFNVDTFNGGQ